MSKRATIIGFAVLVVLLTAGAAQGLSGTNTVLSDDIKDGEVKIADLADLSISTPKIRDRAVTAGKLACGAGASIAAIDVSAVGTEYATTGVQANPRNCSGGAIQAKRLGLGVICVKFLNSSQTHAVASPVIRAFAAVVDRNGSAACGGAAGGTPGQFEVITSTTVAGPTEDIDFTIAAF